MKQPSEGDFMLSWIVELWWFRASVHEPTTSSLSAYWPGQFYGVARPTSKETRRRPPLLVIFSDGVCRGFIHRPMGQPLRVQALREELERNLGWAVGIFSNWGGRGRRI
jgi:hypothetical protein